MIKNYIFYLLFFCCLSPKAQMWDSLGFGVNSSVETFCIDSNNNLIVGGTFINVDGNTQMGLAIWDSLQWLPFGNNPSFSTFGGIYSMTFFNGDLIIGGRFDSINGVSIKNIARWDGLNWNSLGNGFNNSVRTIEVYNNELFAGGFFTQSGIDTVRRFAKWTGSNWQYVSSGYGLDFPVYTSTVYDNKLIIGGQFKTIDGVNFGSIAAWNDTSWSQVGNGFNNEVGKLRVLEDTLYACGTFTQIPLNPSNFICRYDSNIWSQITYPIGNTDWINDIAKYHNQLYVCGNFDNPDDLGVINGNFYDSIGSAFGSIKTLIVYKDQLYVGGDFISIANLTTRCIARFDNLSTGLETSAEFKDFKLYPNPVHLNQDFKVFLPAINKSNIKKIKIVGMTGVLIKEFKSDLETFSIQDIQPGIYIVNVVLTNNNFISQFLIIQ